MAFLSNLPRVSIITPSYNQGQFIERTILSVLNQDYPHIEYIVIDGDSTDNTLKILKKYEERLIWRSEPDKGQSEAINKGLWVATGEIIGWLNSDDTYKPAAIRIAVEALIANPEVAMVYGDCDIIDKDDRKIGIFEGVPVTFRKMLFVQNAFIPQPTVFFRRDVLADIGFLDENMHWSMDTDFFIRIAKQKKVKYIAKNYATYRWHAQSKSLCKLDNPEIMAKSKQDRIAILKKHSKLALLYFYLRYFLISLKRAIFGPRTLLPMLRPKKGVIKIFGTKGFK